MTENAYLVGLRLAGKKVVVIGGGSVAQRRIRLLMAVDADVHVIARAATPAVEVLTTTNPGNTLQLRDYRDGDLDGAWYAIAATDDPSVNAAVVAEADRRQIFCVRADIAREGSAVTPASFHHDGLEVGVLAGGDHRRSGRLDVGDLAVAKLRRELRLEHVVGAGGAAADVPLRNFLNLETGAAQQGAGRVLDALAVLHGAGGVVGDGLPRLHHRSG